MTSLVEMGEYLRVCGELAEARAELSEARDALGVSGLAESVAAAMRLGLTRGCCRHVVAILHRAAPGRFLSREWINRQIPEQFTDERDPAAVQVWVCLARRVLGAAAIETASTVNGPAYRLAPLMRARIDRIIQDGRRAAA